MKYSLDEREGTDYWFPSPPVSGAFEWDGPPLGGRNILTGEKARVPRKDKTLHRKPEKYQRLKKLAQEFMKEKGGAIMIRDAIVHGIRARMFTNSEHHYDFWVENWFSPEEWKKATGREAQEKPSVMVIALIGVEGEEPAAYYNRATNEVIFFNTSYYGQLKSWTVGAIGRVLAEEYGIHSIHGACVAVNAKAILYIAPTGTGKSTSSYGLMSYPGTRFHSDDWVYVRYCYRSKKDSKFYAPLRVVQSGGDSLDGYRVFRWIRQRGEENPKARVEVLTPSGDTVSLELGDLDVSRPPTALGYVSEKKFYLRTNLVESFPKALVEIFNSKTENCPEVSGIFLNRASAVIDEVVSKLLSCGDPGVECVLEGQSWAELRKRIARVVAFGNSRAMFDQSQAFPRGRVIVNPMEPVVIDTVMLIKRNFRDECVLEDLALPVFMERLLRGDTPQGRWEVAYNDYRAVDDEEEQGYLKRLFERAELDGHSIYDEFMRDRANRPMTLDGEFELFEVLHDATHCYDLNTILESAGNSKREAVSRTIQLIFEVLKKMPAHVRLTLQDFVKGENPVAL